MMAGIPKAILYPAVLLAVVLVCYTNSLSCGFVFDDSSAIVDNKDLRPESPISNLLFNDFWGTPMHKERSHKSYRPLCVLTFRLNYAMAELDPMGYHRVNVILHWLVCVLFMNVCRVLFTEENGFKASLLFAVHAVHTEAVTGVVGRAELLSSTLMLLAFITYIKASTRITKTDWRHMILSSVLVVMATLSKEQGITVVGICCVYEVFFLQKYNPWHVLHSSHSVKNSLSSSKKKQRIPAGVRQSTPRLTFLILTAILLLWGRMRIMGARLPSFTRFDNPAASAPFPARHLTYWHLLSVNAWLLLAPYNLLCDWTMGTIPLVTSLADVRNLATAGVVLFLGMLGLYAVLAGNRRSRQVVMALSFLVFPFLPASNLFFPVGFVVAERVLYAPSMGFCMLVILAVDILQANINLKWICEIIFAILLLLHAGRTIKRNYDWENQYTLFTSALKVTRNNAKVWNNIGHSFETDENWDTAIQYFRHAAEVQPDDIGSWINVGRAYRNLGQPAEAEAAYNKAMSFMPKPIPGQRYSTQIDPNHLNVYLNLANLIKSDASRLKEADELYMKAISMRPDFVEAYVNRAEILMRLDRLEEAETSYHQAVRLDPNRADTHYNLGVVAMKKGQKSKALQHFDRAVDLNPAHMMALYNSALYIQESGNVVRRKDAIDRLLKVVDLDPESELGYSTLGMLAMDEGDNEAAIQYYLKAVQINPSSRQSLFNLALLYSEVKTPLKAKPYLETLLEHHPNHTKSMLLLGDIRLNSLRDIAGAEMLFKRIVELEPYNTQALHNLCVILVQRGLLREAEQCLLRVHHQAPNAEYVTANLNRLRQKIQQVNAENKNGNRET